MIKGFFLQLKFLTRIPFFNIEFDEENFARGIIFAPVIGLVIGGLLVLVYLAVSAFENKFVTALCLVFFEIVITGGLHLDGLADTCDGIYSGRNREKMLEIMRDSRIGTNGTIGIIMVLAFKVVLLSALDGGGVITCLLVMPVLSRNNIIIASGISKYARETKGMGESIVNKTGLRAILIGTVITLIICIPVSQIGLAVLFPSSVIFILIFTSYIKSKLGGITGDVIGAAVELSEVVILASVFAIYSPLTGKVLSKIINT